MLSVLSAVSEGVDKPTRIMYATNLSWKPTQSILASLVKQGLLREVKNKDGKRSKMNYELTERGAEVVRYFDRAKALLPLEETMD